MVDLIEGREGGASDGLTKNLKEGNGRKEKEGKEEKEGLLLTKEHKIQQSHWLVAYALL